ncbi:MULTISPECIES: DUF4365 domain-containing protein [unclassified Bradyrhizobium]|uniref:DUF4365 domain-containing protein n=1 Tax=unclassified Bradyrhizobium TaxID=2631580 RepID=UPI0028EFEC87|nr:MULTISPECIES: DUF4365 domain-containing protein [unclassified Bradyrhizobium]
MNLPASHLIDELAASFIQATAAVAGCTISVQRKDYGIDVTLRGVEKSDSGYFETGFPVDLQIKATTTAKFQNDAVIFDLKVSNYDKIARRKPRSAPYYLVLVCFETAQEGWCRISDQDLTLGARAYWWSTDTAKPENRSSARIRIPIDQRLNREAIESMITAAEARYVS